MREREKVGGRETIDAFYNFAGRSLNIVQATPLPWYLEQNGRINFVVDDAFAVTEYYVLQ